MNEAIKQAISYGYSSITVRTDSQLIFNTYNRGWMLAWKRRNWKKADGQPVKNLDLVKELDTLSKRIETKIEHVRGHRNDFGNIRADQLATQGAKMLLEQLESEQKEETG